MMQSLICHCKQRVYEDQETKNRFNDQAASLPHKCQAQPIPLFENMNGIICHRREESIARDITAEALKVGADPFKVQTVRKGDYLILRW